MIPPLVQNIRILNPLKRRHEIGFVVTSTPRSGTAYMAKLLSTIGVPCTHEGSFNLDERKIHREIANPLRKEFWQTRYLWGDASWLVVPFMETLPKQTLVLHQVRDPIKSINSLIHTRHFGGRPDLTRSQWRFQGFIIKHTRDWGIPEDPVDQAIRFWAGWHRAIIDKSGGRKVVRYRLEDLSMELICEIMSFLSAPSIDDRTIRDVLERSNKRENRGIQGKPGAYVDWMDLPPDVVELAAELGYRPER